MADSHFKRPLVMLFTPFTDFRNEDAKTADSSSTCSGNLVPANDQTDASKLDPEVATLCEKDLIIARLQQEISSLKRGSPVPDTSLKSVSSGG